MNDQLETHFAAHSGLAEDRPDVEQADAADFEQIHQQLGAATLDGELRNAKQVDRVVGHQPMAARNQLQAQFTLAQT